MNIVKPIDYPVIFTTPVQITKPIFIAKGRGHAHHLGITAGLFVKNNVTRRWERVFEYHIQKDQNFHDIEPPFRIDHSQDIAIRCTYDSSTQTKKTVFGTSKYNEMCFAHFIYYSEGEEMEMDGNLKSRHLPESASSQFPAPIIQRQGKPMGQMTEGTAKNRKIEQTNRDLLKEKPKEVANQLPLPGIILFCFSVAFVVIYRLWRQRNWQFSRRPLLNK